MSKCKLYTYEKIFKNLILHVIFENESLEGTYPCTRDSTVHLQNSYECHHQSNKCLTPEEEKVPNLLNSYFCGWPYWGGSGKWLATSSREASICWIRTVITAQIPLKGDKNMQNVDKLLAPSTASVICDQLRSPLNTTVHLQIKRY